MTTNSTTQAANIAKLVGLVLMLFGIKVEEGALAGFAEVVGALITAGAILASWIDRYRKGDLSLGGFRLK